MQRCSATTRYAELPHAGGRLFQQYIVDAYAKVETERLNWVYRNQEKLRVESLQGLLDHMGGPNDVSDDFSNNSGDSSSKSAQASGDDLEPALKKLRGPSPCTYTGEYSIPCPKVHVGVPIILPATFGGSPRALHQSYLDAMAIVARFGKPDYFITMTANPNWAEIPKKLSAGRVCS